MLIGEIDFYKTYQDAYSFNRPAHIVANALLNGMVQAGMTPRQAHNVFYSKFIRWALDGDLGDKLDEVCKEYGKQLAKECKKESWINDEVSEELQNELDLAEAYAKVDSIKAKRSKD